MRGYPRGTIVQVEPGIAHKEFVGAVRPDYVLLKIHYARQLLKRGQTASEYFPDDVKVITTTSIRDKVNSALPLESNGYKRGEWEIVRDFEPAFHIPADRSDYIDFSDEKRFDRIRECMHGTLTMSNHVASSDIDTTILPFLKGVKKRERWLCYKTIEQLGMDYVVFYANGYFNSGDGNHRRKLIEDLQYLADEAGDLMDHTDDIEICVLNCQSPRLLEKMPDEVVASSGLWVGQNRGWREKVTPTKQSDTELREIFENVDQRVRSALELPERSEHSTPVSDQSGAERASADEEL